MTKEQDSIITLFNCIRAFYQVKGMTLKKAEKEAYKDLVRIYGEKHLEELFKDEIETQK